jgi:hypothetical protein
MQKITLAKIFFCLAALLFVAKPFLGFSMFSRMHPPAVENIFVKAFTKRKLEEQESSKLNPEAIQKKLAEAAQQFVFRFIALLSILLPLFLSTVALANNNLLRRLKLSLTPAQPSWLLNGNLII